LGYAWFLSNKENTPLMWDTFERRACPFPETRLGNVAAEHNADLGECAVQAACQAGHASGSRERYQCQNRQIFHQTLARFIIVKAIQDLHYWGFHCCCRFLWSRCLRRRDGTSIWQHIYCQFDNCLPTTMKVLLDAFYCLKSGKV
jgi:hypothetical protein